MFNKFSTLLFVFIFSLSIFAQQSKDKLNEQIIDVNFCDLLKNSDDYKDKILRIKATYISFFEASKIYCSDCIQRRGTWVEFNDLEETTKKTYRNRLKNNAILNVVFVGKFYTGKTYGYENGYDSQFVVEKIENADVISKKLVEKLPIEIESKTYCQTNN